MKVCLLSCTQTQSDTTREKRGQCFLTFFLRTEAGPTHFCTLFLYVCIFSCCVISLLYCLFPSRKRKGGWGWLALWIVNWVLLPFLNVMDLIGAQSVRARWDEVDRLSPTHRSGSMDTLRLFYLKSSKGVQCSPVYLVGGSLSLALFVFFLTHFHPLPFCSHPFVCLLLSYNHNNIANGITHRWLLSVSSLRRASHN